MIRSLSSEFSVKALCRALGVSRSGYYAARKKAERPRARDNARLGAKIKESFEASRRTYGSPRLAVVLRRAGETCGRHRVARLMRVHRLRAAQKRRFRPRTTDSRHLCPIAPNHLLARTVLTIHSPQVGCASKLLNRTFGVCYQTLLKWVGEKIGGTASVRGHALARPKRRRTGTG